MARPAGDRPCSRPGGTAWRPRTDALQWLPGAPRGRSAYWEHPGAPGPPGCRRGRGWVARAWAWSPRRSSRGGLAQEGELHQLLGPMTHAGGRPALVWEAPLPDRAVPPSARASIKRGERPCARTEPRETHAGRAPNTAARSVPPGADVGVLATCSDPLRAIWDDARARQAEIDGGGATDVRVGGAVARLPTVADAVAGPASGAGVVALATVQLARAEVDAAPGAEGQVRTTLALAIIADTDAVTNRARPRGVGRGATTA